MKKTVEMIISFLSSCFIFLFGSFDFVLKSLITLMILDYITGVGKAFITKKVNSSVGGVGIVKKAIYLCIVAVSVLLDNILEAGGGIRTLIIYSFIFNEILSILENSKSLGIKIPNAIYKSLEKLNQNEEK